MKKITSRDNAEYRRLWRLAHSVKQRRSSGLALLDGDHLVRSYADAFGPDDLQLYLRDSAADQPEIRALAARAGERVTRLADRLFDSLSPVETPVGILAIAPIRRPPAAADGFLVWIDRIQDPGNLGSILRSAAAAGASEAWVSHGSADPWSPRCLRGGMGAHFRLAVRDEVALAAAARGFPGRIVVAEGDAPLSVYDADLSGRIAFVLGAEGTGVSKELLELAHVRVKVPMQPGIESLNVAAAAAVLFYEWRRRRQAA